MKIASATESLAEKDTTWEEIPSAVVEKSDSPVELNKGRNAESNADSSQEHKTEQSEAADNAQIQDTNSTTAPDENPADKLKVKTWWAHMTNGLKEFSIEYLLDTTTPFSRDANTHVLVDSVAVESPSKAETAGSPEARIAEEQRRSAIILEVAKRALSASTSPPQHQPKVSFDNGKVHIEYDNAEFLMSLWKSPLVVHGKTMPFVSRGLPMFHPSVFRVSGSTVLTEARLDSEVKSFVGGRNKQSIHILAGFYEVEGFPGGPNFNGDARIFWGCYYQKRTPFFGSKLLEEVTFACDPGLH